MTATKTPLPDSWQILSQMIFCQVGSELSELWDTVSELVNILAAIGKRQARWKLDERSKF